MNVFILEDSSFRIEFFKAWLEKEGHSLSFSKDVEEAQRILSQKKFDYIFLDHDLDDDPFGKYEEENTGYQLCKWLREHPSFTPSQVIVHTMNGAGAENMMKELRQCPKKLDIKRVPFDILRNQL